MVVILVVLPPSANVVAAVLVTAPTTRKDDQLDNFMTWMFLLLFVVSRLFPFLSFRFQHRVVLQKTKKWVFFLFCLCTNDTTRHTIRHDWLYSILVIRHVMRHERTIQHSRKPYSMSHGFHSSSRKYVNVYHKKMTILNVSLWHPADNKFENQSTAKQTKTSRQPHPKIYAKRKCPQQWPFTIPYFWCS